jgi:beta-lactamase class A
LVAALAEVEATTGGRLGVFARDFASGVTLAHRADERFPMCSTFKVLAVGAVLRRVDLGYERLDRRIAYGRGDLLDYAPATSAHVREGRMTVEALCAAAVVMSDNTAANLLLRSLGGPQAVTTFVRSTSLGDFVTRLDRTEPALNSAIPGDVRDTTTPRSMAHTLALLLTTSSALSRASSRLLCGWMRACQTGTSAIRAGVPSNWSVADKTGSGDNGTRNDVALLRPANRAPIVVTAYLTGATAIDGDKRDAALAQVGAIVARSARRPL